MTHGRRNGIGQVSYEASPTAASLRNNLISLGLMAAAPAPGSAGITHEDEGITFEDYGIEHEDT